MTNRTRQWLRSRRAAIWLGVLVVLASAAFVAAFLGPKLVTDEEMVKIRAQLDEAATSNRAQSCKRPVLRSSPVPGSGTAAFAAAVVGNRTCRLALESHHDALEALTRPEQPPSLWSHRQLLEIALGATEPSEFQACNATFAKLLAASQHEGVCGRLDNNSDQEAADDPAVSLYDSTLFRLTKIVAAQANDRWNRYEDGQAFKRLLDGTRISQDFGRASNLLDSVLSVRSFEYLATTMERFLNDATREIAPVVLTRVVRELRRLIEGEPDLHDTWVIDTRSLLEAAPPRA